MAGLSDKVAIVTGASRGIGAAIALRLARDGVNVVVHYRRSDAAAAEIVDRIRAVGRQAFAVQADLGDTAGIRELFRQTLSHFGRLDILVNNAAVAEARPLSEVDENHYRRQFDVNVLGVLTATQEAARAFSPAGGSIINISSGAAQAAPPGMSVYSASKAAVEVLTRSHAAELGPRGIRVNAVSPGITETDMMAEMVPPAVQQALIASTALRRLGRPDDIADVVAFLASDEARWITGAVIPASGGLR